MAALALRTSRRITIALSTCTLAWLLLGTGYAGAAAFIKLTGARHEPAEARNGAVAAALPDGEVLIAGGSGTSAELFNPRGDTFRKLTGPGQSLTQPRRLAVAATLPSGQVLIAGCGEKGSERSAELFDPVTEKFTLLTGKRRSLTEPRCGAIAATLPSGQVLIAGGSNFHASTGHYESRSSAELFDPATDTFRKLTGSGQSMVQARDGASAATLPSGDVLIVGGYTGLSPGTVTASAEIFDPSTDTFSMLTGPEQSLSEARYFAVAATLPSGQVLIAGGSGQPCDLCENQYSSAELFDPATDTFSPTASLTEPRSVAVAASLPSGQVLIAGGEGPARRARAETFGAELFSLSAQPPRPTPGISIEVLQKSFTVGESQEIGAFSSSGQAPSIVSLTPSVCTISRLSPSERVPGHESVELHPNAIGTCTIAARVEANAEYRAAEEQKSITVRTAQEAAAGTRREERRAEEGLPKA